MRVFDPNRRYGAFMGGALLGASLGVLSGCSSPERANDPLTALVEDERAEADPAADAPDAEGASAGELAGPPPEPAGSGDVLEDLARDLTLREQESRALAEHYFNTGMRYYEGFDYREAAENFQRALDANPNDARIRQFLLQAQLLAGDRHAEFETVAELLSQQRQVSIEQERADLRRLYEEGEACADAFRAGVGEDSLVPVSGGHGGIRGGCAAVYRACASRAA